jgi:hypothetical protein
MRACGADELDTVFITQIRELSILRQEAVSWVHSISSRQLDSGDNVCHIEVGVLAPRRAYTYCLIGETHVKAISVCSRVYGYGFDAHLLACTNDAQGYLSSIGYQYFFEHMLKLQTTPDLPMDI